MSTWNTRLVFSRTPLGCVDRNRDEVGKWIPAGVAPHWGAWIEINGKTPMRNMTLGTALDLCDALRVSNPRKLLEADKPKESDSK